MRKGAYILKIVIRIEHSEHNEVGFHTTNNMNFNVLAMDISYSSYTDIDAPSCKHLIVVGCCILC